MDNNIVLAAREVVLVLTGIASFIASPAFRAGYVLVP